MKKLVILSALMASNVFAATNDVEPTLDAKAYADKGLQNESYFPGLASLCDLSAEPRNMFKPRDKKENTADRKPRKRNADNNRARKTIAPQQVFDNLYYVGAGNVASWAIDTGESIVLVDALNNDKQAETYIAGGLKALGLDDKPVSHLIISHGHGDHYGGFQFVKDAYNANVVMSDTEWKVLERDDFASGRWGAKPQRDMSVSDGDVLTVNGTQLSLYVTPGHTPGTLTVVFPVYDNGQVHRAVLWGGTGLNYGPDVKRIKTYTESAKTMKEYVKSQNIDVFLSNHPGRAGTKEKLDKLAARKDGEAHAFVQGKDIVVKAFDLLENCTRAQWMNIEEKKRAL